MHQTKPSIHKYIPTLFLILFLLPQLLHHTHAETKEELEANKTDLATKIKALDREILEFSKKIKDTQGEATTLKEALASLIARREVLLLEIKKTNTRILDTKSKIASTESDISSTTKKIESRRSSLSESLRTLAMLGDSVPLFIRALSPTTQLSDILDDVSKSSDVAKTIQDNILTLRDLYTQQEVAKTKYEDSKTLLENLSSTLMEQQVLVDQSKKETDKLITATKNKEAEYQKLVAERKKKKNSLEAEMMDIESKIKTIVDATKIPKYGKGVLRFPVDNVIITQYFGNTPFASQNPQVYNGSGHNGIDLGIKVGTPIYSAASGVVVDTGDTDASCSGVSYGKWVLVRHDNGLSTLYAHLSLIQVTQGQQVGNRQKIALSGNTGYSTGPHLHFTVYASDSVKVETYRSKVCGTNMTMPIAPRPAYLNPLSYL